MPGKLFSDNFRANLKIDQDMLYIDDVFLCVYSKIMGQTIEEGALVYGVDIVRGPEVTIKRNPLWQKF